MLCPKRYAAPENSTGMNGLVFHLKNWRFTVGRARPTPGVSTESAIVVPTTFGRKSCITIHW